MRKKEKDMKKLCKRFFAICLLLIILAVTVSCSLIEQLIGGLCYQLSEDGTYWSVYYEGYCRSTEIEIPSMFKGKPVKAINSLAFDKCSSLKKIILPETITIIGEYAFFACDSLESIEIPNGVTHIGTHAFARCAALKNIEVPAGVLTIEDGVFSECHSLVTVTLPDSLVDIGGGAFLDCPSLENINIPDGVTHLGINVFGGCSKLVQNENGICYVDRWVVSSDKDITELTLRNDTQGLSDEAFQYCKISTNVILPEGIKYIGNAAFRYCSSLKGISIPDSVVKIGAEAFWCNDSLMNIEVGENNLYYRSVDGNLYDKELTTLLTFAPGKMDERIVLPKSVLFLNKNCFYQTAVAPHRTIVMNCTIEAFKNNVGDTQWGYCNIGQNSNRDITMEMLDGSFSNFF